ncbi:mitochondrial carrier [Coprinopsis marcescibilis]|uniref:Mitochondrial carrier n=1 Tax=Coprinopsis marcescibilis TaxID=230819 RepID=A0A5C3KI83_COPMA|nr:mitochondrial carrier [Coprinopsis marcescibilis]
MILLNSCGGVATVVSTSPLDVVRVRLQSDLYPSVSRVDQSTVGPLVGKSGLHQTVLRTFIQSLNETCRMFTSIGRFEGWRGYFRGLGPSLIGVVPGASMKYFVYGNSKRLWGNALSQRRDATLVNALAAMSSNLVRATALNPIWLIRTRLQLDHSKKDGSGRARRYKNAFDCTRQIAQQEGFRGFYKGISASYLGTVDTVLHLSLYEHLKLALGRPFRQQGSRSFEKETFSELGS